MTQPISPAEIRQRQDHTVDCIQESVDFINRLLTTDAAISLLLNGKPVEVYDSSNYEPWYVGRDEAVKQFTDAGWNVTVREVPPKIKGSERREFLYYFRLPEEAKVEETGR